MHSLEKIKSLTLLINTVGPSSYFEYCPFTPKNWPLNEVREKTIQPTFNTGSCVSGASRARELDRPGFQKSWLWKTDHGY